MPSDESEAPLLPSTDARVEVELRADGALLRSERSGLRLTTAAWGRPGATEAPIFEAASAVGVDRVERGGEALREWWIAKESGVEQGWTVAASPVGGGALHIEVSVEEASAQVSPHRVVLTTAEGETWLAERFAAWDAEGRALPLEVLATADGFAVAVDDTDATYPVQVDPLYTTATTEIAGTSTWFATSLAGAGDVDGDGYDDVIISSYAHSTYRGGAWVYHGSSGGLSTTATTTITGASTYAYLGRHVDGVGDVNGDGYDDVIVGAYGLSRAYLHLGSAAGVSSTAATTFSGSDTNYSQAVSGAGDVNGDGYSDLLVGAMGNAGSTGRVYVFHGSASGVSTSASTTLTGTVVGGLFGNGLDGAGDVNADGYDDVVIGEYGYSSNTGRAYVYHGSATGLSTSPTTTLTGASSNARHGYAVGGAGDVDADGYDDVIVGAFGRGTAYVYRGSATGVSTTATATLAGGGILGFAVGGVGDLDGDGHDDVAAGDHEYDTRRGRAQVFLGEASGVGTTAVASPQGTTRDGDYFGFVVASAGDVDADGLDDMLIAAPLWGGGTGKAYLYNGDVDDDGDGYGSADDCDDADALVNPGASEVCDPSDVDEDCSGAADDVDSGVSSASLITHYADNDGDGYGDASSAASACEAPAGRVSTAGDCDDTDAAVRPGVTEVCDAGDTDEDCSGAADDADAGVDSAGFTTFYADADGDGTGNASASVSSCDAPAGHGSDASDCDDSNAAVYPGATEVCDAANTDEDCNGLADNADEGVDRSGYTTFNMDRDGDGHGNPGSPLAACDLPTGYATAADDCDDDNAAVNPGATEVCDALGTDDDCNGAADDDDAGVDTTTFATWYADADMDGFGSAAAPTSACDVPSGHVADAADCDDADAYVHPDAAEVCDAVDVDEDCSGAADDADATVDLETQTRFYIDGDGDGHGDPGRWFEACDQPVGHVAVGDDCDDGRSGVNPDAAEVCDGADTDEDCDGAADDADAGTDPSGHHTFFADADGDGHGDAEHPTSACDLPDAHADVADDCDDSRAGVHPGAAEVCDDADTDEDCDGAADDADADVDDADRTTWYADADGDTHGDPDASVDACDAPDAHVAEGGDCDDEDAEINPEADEIAGDGVDQDCDGEDPGAGEDPDADGPGADDPTGPGCGCASAPGGDAGLLAAFALLATTTLRRRRSPWGPRLGRPDPGEG
jgi:MYXO-CTERM domain-containing protein